MTLALHPAAAGFFSLTKLQQHALLVIQELTELDGRPPSYSEIAHELCLSSRSVVYRLVEGLVDRGWIERAPHHAHSIVVKRRLPMPEEPVFVLPAQDEAAGGAT